MKNGFIIFLGIQILIWILILFNSASDIQFLPAVMIILNAINMIVLYKALSYWDLKIKISEKEKNHN